MNRIPLLLLLIAAFLAPLLGGQVFLGAMPLSEGFSAGIRGPELPITAHAILGGLAVMALMVSLTVRKVVQLPNPVVLLSLVAVLFSFGMACGISAFRSVSWFHWLEWIAYGVGLCTAVAVMGRGRGPRATLWAIAVGTALVAIEGILEYGNMRAIDPTWRIFAGWVNPNALAGMLLIGGLLALGLVVAESERLAKLGAGSLAVLIGFALFLSQSRGGIVAFLVGLIALIAFQLAYGAKLRVVTILAPLVVVGLLAVSVRTAPAPNANATPSLSRVGNVSSTAEQSSGYRILLWKGAIHMIKENPFGTGLGTYRYESARSGLTPQTQFAHQGFLQIGVESGVLGLMVWLAFGGGWLWTTVRGSRRLSQDRAMLLGTVFAAIIGSAAHNFFDSDWQHFGIGFTFFILMGVGLQLSGDGSMPEMVPKQARVYGLIGGCAILTVALLHTSLTEVLKARALDAAARGDLASARSSMDLALRLSPSDGEAYRIAGQLTPETAMTNGANAARFAPSTKNLRAWARDQLSAGDIAGAQKTLISALERDPNNLPTLLLLIKLCDQQGDTNGLKLWGDRLIAVEQSPYFTVRALPLVIPTETYEGRLILAKSASEEEAITLRWAAIRGLANYARTTVPQIQAQVKVGGNDYAGETTKDATEKLALGRSACNALRTSLQRLGRPLDDLDALETALAEPSFSGPLGGP